MLCATALRANLGDARFAKPAPLLLSGSSVSSSTAGTPRPPSTTAASDLATASTAWLASTQTANQTKPATLFDAIDGNDCAALRSLIDQATRHTDAALAEALSMVQTRTLAGTSPRDYTPLMAAIERGLSQGVGYRFTMRLIRTDGIGVE